MPAEEVKNLGVTFDSENTFDNHTGKSLLDLLPITSEIFTKCVKFLFVDTPVLVANAMVRCRLDFHSSALCDFSKGSVAKLQN